MKTRMLILGLLGLGTIGFAGQRAMAAERRDSDRPAVVRYDTPVRYDAFNDRRDADDHDRFDRDHRDFDRRDRDEHRDWDAHTWSYDRDDIGYAIRR